MKKVRLTERPYEGIPVVRDAGVQHPENDTDKDRTFTAGEEVSLRLDSPYRHLPFPAVVVAVSPQRLTVRALVPVYPRDERGRPFGKPFVRSGRVFNVRRECVFTVTKK